MVLIIPAILLASIFFSTGTNAARIPTRQSNDPGLSELIADLATSIEGIGIKSNSLKGALEADSGSIAQTLSAALAQFDNQTNNLKNTVGSMQDTVVAGATSFASTQNGLIAR